MTLYFKIKLMVKKAKLLFAIILIICICLPLVKWSQKIKIENITNLVLAQTTIEDCSTINLISTPEKYHEKRIRVIGYVVLKFEHQAIYLSENYAKHHITKNGIWIFLEDMNKSIQIPKKIEGGYYLIVGTFDKNMFGHGALYSGGITKIERFTRWSK